MFRIGNFVCFICVGNRNVFLEYQRLVLYSDFKRQLIIVYLQFYDLVQGFVGEEQCGVFEFKILELCKFFFVDFFIYVNVLIRVDNFYEILLEEFVLVENEVNGLL